MIHTNTVKSKLLLILLFFSSLKFFSQGEGNHWYFGFNAGVDFSSGTPVADLNGKLSTWEGCSSISSETGDLLFYTDGSFVYNKNHDQMPNGSGLFGNSSSAQSAIIVKKPGSSSLYYVFTTPYISLGGMYYSLIDLSLNGGLGDVVATEKNVLLDNSIGEKLTAVKHKNGLYTWVIANSNTNGGKYIAFLVDCGGVNTMPVVSATSFLGTGLNAGSLAASLDGSKIASTSYANLIGFEIFDFDNSTGILSNGISTSPGGSPYGISFSPSGNLLYVSSHPTGDIFQYDILAGSAAAIFASQTTIGTVPFANGLYNWVGGNLQIGPDGKIYCARNGATSISVIHNPNTLGVGSNFQLDAVSLGGKTCGMGLPAFLLNYLDTLKFSATQTCKNNTTKFSLFSDSTALTGALWNFGDPTTGVNNTSTFFNPSHVFSDVGTYSVSVIRYFSCGSDTSYQNINIVPDPTITVNSATMCVNNTATLIASGATSYTWSSGLSATTGSMVVGNPLTTTSYTVIGNNNGDNCFGIGQSTITVITPSVSISSTNSVICIGQQTVTLTASGANSYTWSTNDMSTSVVKSPTITTTYTVVGLDVNSCYNYTTTTINVNSLPNVSANNATICSGQQSATLTASGANTYTWNTNDVSTSIIQSPTSTTNYTVVGVDVNGCYNYTTCTVFTNTLPTISANNATICLGQQSATLTASGASTYTWNTSATTASIIQSPSITTTYSVVGVDNNTCFNTAVTTVSVLTLPTITVSSTIGNTVCPSSTITLSSNGANSYTYFPAPNFSNGTGSSVIISPLNNTTYTVIGNTNGCLDTAQLSIYIANNPTITATGDTICSAQSGTISANGGITYTWSPSSALNTANGSVVIASPLSTTIYTVNGASALGCIGSTTAQVVVIPSPTITITQMPSGTLKIGDVVQLNASSSANNYTWSPVSYLSCTNCANPNASPSVTTEYCLTSDNANCTNSLCITVDVETPCATNETLGLPNAFSPNGDGINDEYCLQGWNDCVESFSLSVFNRWGEKVFTTNDPAFCWDGKVLGKICDPAVFTYYAKAKLKNGSAFSKKGNITLIK